MHGAGTKTATTKNSPAPAFLLDVTRLLRRAGRVATGVDRVEAAYLQRLLQEDRPIFGLARTRLGYVLLDRDGLRGFQARLQGDLPWGAVDGLSRLARRLTEDQKRAEADLRRLALKRCLPGRLGRMLQRQLPSGICYFNLGHSNLTERVLHSLKHRVQARIVVMVHDTIPLDFPQYQRVGSVQPFAMMLERVRRHADLILCNSSQTEADLTRHLSAKGPLPPCAVLPLGVELAEAEPVTLPVGFDPKRPSFVALGTIEPRKNHALLLDIWDDFSGADAPQLLILGHRGWNNDPVFVRLDQLKSGGPVFELPGLSDGQVRSVLEQSTALVFPSFAEGYGLPPIEALTLGLPVLCADLPVCRDLLGDNVVYLQVNDRYSWAQQINTLAKSWRAENRVNNRNVAQFVPHSWDTHFNAVLKLV